VTYTYTYSRFFLHFTLASWRGLLGLNPFAGHREVQEGTTLWQEWEVGGGGYKKEQHCDRRLRLEGERITLRSSMRLKVYMYRSNIYGRPPPPSIGAFETADGAVYSMHTSYKAPICINLKNAYGHHSAWGERHPHPSDSVLLGLYMKYPWCLWPLISAVTIVKRVFLH
jgi:hypothetical protein